MISTRISSLEVFERIRERRTERKRRRRKEAEG